MRANKKQAAIGFIFITMLIDITGWGIIIPVIPKLIEELIHGDLSEAAKSRRLVDVRLCDYAIFHVRQLLVILSDQYGRRPVILISLFGLLR